MVMKNAEFTGSPVMAFFAHSVVEFAAVWEDMETGGPELLP